jgi:hypothetical protein
LALKKVFSDDFNTQKLQDNLADGIRKIENNIILNGVVITSKAVAITVDNQINHGLGRKPVGFLIVDSNSDVRVWQSATANQNKDKYLLLKFSASAIVTLYIF